MRGEASHRRGLAAALAMLACAILAGGGGSAASAGAAEPRHQKSIDAIVRFLEEHQLESGAYADPGADPTQSITAWVTMALAAASVNPRDQTRFAGGLACGHSAQEFLEAHFPESFHEELAWPAVATTAFERELLVVDTAGTDPHDFAGYDLVAEIVGRQKPDGSIPYVPGGEGQINDAVFGILALAPIKEPAAEAAVHAAAEWLLTAQNSDGGFNWKRKGLPSEADLTGAAIEALVAAGDGGTEVEARALAFLRGAQLPDGGLPELPSSEAESNVASTAWAVQGIWAGGGDPETWVVGAATPPAEPLDYMESMQQPDGHIRWRASSDMNGIWMTAYVLPAFTGQALSYPLVPRSGASAGSRLPSCQTAAGGEAPVGGDSGGMSTQPVEGAGGASRRPVEGVGAGGGGGGAPDFSRPQPGSKGKTPGGARIVHHKGGETARDRSRSRRGPNRHQASGTETAEPQAKPEADQEVEAVSAGAAAAAGPGEGGGGGRDQGAGSGDRGAPLPAKGARRAPRAAAEVSGVVIGSPDGKQGKLAFGAPGLRSGGRSGGAEEPWVPAAIGAAAIGALAFGLHRELRGRYQGRPA